MVPLICWVWVLTGSQFSHIAPLNMEIVDRAHGILAACWKDIQSTVGPQGIIFHYWMLDYIFGNRSLIQPERSLLQSRWKFYFKTHSNFILGERGELSWHEWAFFCYFLVILESAFVLVPTQATKLLFVLVFVIRGCLSRQKCGCNFMPKQVPETHCDLHKHHRSCSTPTTSARACAFFGAMNILNRCVLDKSLASDKNDILASFGPSAQK